MERWIKQRFLLDNSDKLSKECSMSKSLFIFMVENFINPYEHVGQ